MLMKILALLSGALLAAAAPGINNPSNDLRATMTTRASKRATVMGRLFDRIMFIYLENTPYANAVADR